MHESPILDVSFKAYTIQIEHSRVPLVKLQIEFINTYKFRRISTVSHHEITYDNRKRKLNKLLIENCSHKVATIAERSSLKDKVEFLHFLTFLEFLEISQFFQKVSKKKRPCIDVFLQWLYLLVYAFDCILVSFSVKFE